jgi:shikimate 5-dehydrogenase
VVADVLFVGVTTGASLIHKAMPLWQSLLGVPCTVRGVDIGLDADDDAYIRFLERLRNDIKATGAVVTGHKVKMFRAGRSYFRMLDPLALECGEVNAIRRTDEGLFGWARDPVSVGRVADRIWPRTVGDVVCLGAGGTALALAHHLMTTREHVHFVCADPDRDAVARLAALTGQELFGHVGKGPWDDLVASARPGSLIVNATGMGKDRPGSPISDKTRFPPESVVWELNYRGDLPFLEHARHEALRYPLAVHDGWHLFCHGWAAALTAVLDLEDNELGDRFAAASLSLRPSLSL